VSEFVSPGSGRATLFIYTCLHLFASTEQFFDKTYSLATRRYRQTDDRRTQHCAISATVKWSAQNGLATGKRRLSLIEFHITDKFTTSVEARNDNARLSSPAAYGTSSCRQCLAIVV